MARTVGLRTNSRISARPMAVMRRRARGLTGAVVLDHVRGAAEAVALSAKVLLSVVALFVPA